MMIEWSWERSVDSYVLADNVYDEGYSGIMRNENFICRIYANIIDILMRIMRKICENYAKIMQTLCGNYAEIMRKLCGSYAKL